MVCVFRAHGWAASFRLERPGWPFHQNRLNRSGSALIYQKPDSFRTEFQGNAGQAVNVTLPER
jgi:hypothetical protein